MIPFALRGALEKPEVEKKGKAIPKKISPVLRSLFRVDRTSDITSLFRDLTAKDVRARREAARELSNIFLKERLIMLNSSFLKDLIDKEKDPQVRWSLAQAYTFMELNFLSYRDKEAEMEIIRLLRSPDLYVRRATVAALQRAAWEGRNIPERPLLGVLRDEDKFIKERAIDALHRYYENIGNEEKAREMEKYMERDRKKEIEGVLKELIKKEVTGALEEAYKKRRRQVIEPRLY